MNSLYNDKTDLKIGHWYQIVPRVGRSLMKPVFWEFCGKNEYGYLFVRFTVDYHISEEEADSFVFYEDPHHV